MMDRSQFLAVSTTKLLSAAPALRQPVSLEVPVRVQGESNGHATFFEDTNTVLVFNEGAVLRVAGHLHAGQSLLLTNRATRQQAACRVAYVKQHGNVRGYAEVEFAMPAPGFWEETPGRGMAPQSFSATAAAIPPISRLAPRAPAATIRVTESLAQVENIANPIDVAPWKSAKAAMPPPALRQPVKFSANNPIVMGMAAQPAPLVDEIEQILAAQRVETEVQAQEAARAASEFVSKLLDPAAQGAFAPPVSSKRPRWMLGTIAAALLLTLGTALGSWGLQAEVSRIAPPAPVAPEPPAWAVAGLFAPVGSIAGLPMRRPRTLYVFSMPLPESVRRAAEMHRALTTAKLATPVAAPRLDFGDSAFPEIGSVAPANSAVLTLVPVAPVHVTAPVVPMESKLEPLRLVFSTKPVYPALARRAGTQGEVVIHARVDEAGKVALLRVISGPPALRQAALDALSQWKYAPARLNGKPVTVDTAVNVKFQL